MTSVVIDVRDPDPRLSALATTVAGTADTIGDQAAEAIRDHVPAYRSEDPVLHSEVAQHCRAVFRTIVACMSANRSPETSDFAFTTDVALHRVTQGVGIADFMRGFRIAQIVFWHHLDAAIVEQAVPADVTSRTVEILLGVIEIGSSAAARAYLEAEQYRLADQDRARRDLLDDLIAGNKPIIGPRRGALQTVGITESAPFEMFSVVLVETDHRAPTADQLRRARARVREALVDARGSTGAGLVVARHDEIAAMVKHTGDDLAAILTVVRETLAADGIDVAAGVSTVHTGLSHAPTAYQEACIARRFLGSAGGIVPLPTISPLSYLTVADDPVALRLVDPRVAAFVADELSGDGVLLHTLDAYASGNLNATLAAERLHIHVNTMYYRLDRIAERTGAELRDFRAMADLMVAVGLVERARHR